MLYATINAIGEIVVQSISKKFGLRGKLLSLISFDVIGKIINILFKLDKKWFDMIFLLRLSL